MSSSYNQWLLTKYRWCNAPPVIAVDCFEDGKMFSHKHNKTDLARVLLEVQTDQQKNRMTI